MMELIVNIFFKIYSNRRISTRYWYMDWYLNLVRK